MQVEGSQGKRRSQVGGKSPRPGRGGLRELGQGQQGQQGDQLQRKLLLGNTMSGNEEQGSG